MLHESLKNRIRKVLPLIQRDVEQVEEYDGSLLKNLGCLLFTAAYARYSGTSPDEAIDRFARLIDSYELPVNGYQTFSEGYPSMGMLYYDLVRKQFLERDPALEAAFREITLTAGRQQLALDNYDLLYGATGLLHYLLAGDSKDSATVQFIADYIDCLKQKAIAFEAGQAWADHYYYLRKQGTAVNMGLAHGLPAILKAWVSIYKCTEGKLRTDAEGLIRSTAAFLMNATNKKETQQSLYGAYWIPDQAEEHSRLAWCYGDPGIGFSLYQAGLAIADEPIRRFGEAVLLSTTARRTEAQTNIKDAGLCHGSAGIAHLYHRMARHTGNPVFWDATAFWIGKTLTFAGPGPQSAGFQKYNPVERQYETDHGFLEGSAGIGLALLSCLTGEYEWDYHLMLNG